MSGTFVKVELNQINKITESTLTTTLSLFVEKTQLIAVSSDRLTFYKVKRVSLELKIIPAISSLAFFLQKQNKVAVNVDSVILLIWFKISLKLLISLWLLKLLTLLRLLMLLRILILLKLLAPLKFNMIPNKGSFTIYVDRRKGGRGQPNVCFDKQP